MKVIVKNRVWPEVLAAAEWYDRQSDGLGGAFVRAVDDVAVAIEEAPLRFPVVYKDARRAHIERFPYGAFFAIRHDAVYIFSVCHLQRNPRAWQRWIPKP